MIVLQATWAELEGGPGEHHKRAGRAPSPDHLRLDRHRHRPDTARPARPGQPGAPAGLAGAVRRPAGRVRLEGCTGWRYVVEELRLAGITAHLAEPTDTRALRGHKRHAKTDRADARHLRDLLMGGRLPESWIPPAHVLEARTQVRLHKALVDQRTAWQQRIHADCSATACRPSPICWSPSAASA
jgi:hypothetical protein